MEWTGLILGALGLVLGGVLKGATGAGAPLLAVPLLAVFYDVPMAVALFTIPNLLSNVWQGWRFRRHQLNPALTWGFALAGAAGAGVGSAILVSLPLDLLLLCMAGVVFLYIAFRLMRPHWALDLGIATRLAALAGFAGGVLQGAAGISAPVSLSFLNATRMDRTAFIATISVFFAATSIVQIPLLAAWDIITPFRAALSALALLPLLAGMPLGVYLARRMSREFFDRVILVLLAAIALRLVFSAVT
ncbi:sulfite exporter TauE/SafE family protein [Pelagibius sp. CAU 1746]|uniref:sulfite exporter TauE/SafE family protein n=1 Tax=Pelagibius sp. CAU 1746 TaxID=3140370 RepID=UPI00325B5B48